MNSVEAFNRRLDHLARPQIQLGQCARSAFRVCGLTGYVLAVALTSFLIGFQGFSVFVLVGVAVVGALTFFVLAITTKFVLGREALIYYHHEIAVMLAAALALWLTRQPVLPYLDVTILGLGTFLACGRVGCFMVGCCHGRPHRLGVCYRREHADAGFPDCYVNVRLFPIQLVESCLVTLIVVAGASMILRRAQPGDVLGWYIVAYGVMRFVLEFARGDSGRPYWLGFSEAQWTSLILMALGTVGQWLGVLSLYRWHTFATMAIALSMIGIYLKRRFESDSAFALLRPDHLREIALVTSRFAARQATVPAPHPVMPERPKAIAIATTSLGVHISSSRVQESGHNVDVFALSRTPSKLSARLAGVLADLICRLRQARGQRELLTRNEQIFHLLIRDHEPAHGAEITGAAASPLQLEKPGLLRVSLNSSGHAPGESGVI